MATRNNMKPEFKDDIDDPALPPEFTHDDDDNLSLDTITGTEFNRKRMNEDLKRISPPDGTWMKEDRWENFKRSINVNDSMPDDIDENGRTVYSIYGKPTPRIVDDTEHQPTLFIRVSPDIRYKKDDTTKFDLAYTMFLKASEVYLAIHGSELTNDTMLKYFLEEDEFALRTMKGDNGLVVTGIQQKRLQRR